MAYSVYIRKRQVGYPCGWSVSSRAFHPLMYEPDCTRVTVLICNTMKSPFLFVAALLALLILAPHAAAIPNGCAGAANAEMCTLIERGSLAELRHPDFRVLAAQVDDFYRFTNYQLAWVTNGRPTRQARELIRSLQQAGKEGLLSTDYDGPQWAGRLFRLAHTAPQPASDFARFDLALTVSVMRFISDLRCGHNSHQQQRFGSDGGCWTSKLAEFVRNRLVNAADTRLVLKEAEPPYEGYRLLKAALQHYLAIAQENEREVHGDNEAPVNPGDRCSFLLQLERRLQQLGDLPEDRNIPVESGVYEGTLVDAIKRFQSRHGLSPDGIIDAETFKQLNTPMRQRILQLRLALERWRWLPHELPARLILINVPGFQLTAFDGKRASLSMRTIVGEAFDGNQGHDHRTPLLRSSLESLVLFPTWNIPAKIAVAEILPAMLTDSGYLTDHQYELVNRQGSAVAPDSYSPGILHKILDRELEIRQKPGPENPLGSIKFVFSNRYGIYIHGTPEQELFSYARRDYSHGCIRVEDPVALAEWVLRNQAPNMAEQVRLSATNDVQAFLPGATSASFTITLLKSIPVIIVYQTAVIGENKDVHFFDDIYGMDIELANAIGSR